MALIIKLKCSVQPRGETVYWYIGAEKLNPKLSSLDVDNIIHIYAYGDELEFIKNKFKRRTGDETYSIPMIWSTNAMYWYGDIAKTIIANILS